MIIDKVRARGFGLFETLEVELGPHLTVVHGPNETGKTTLAEAIFAALYGAFDTTGTRAKSRPEVTRLKPWAGGDFTVAVDVQLADGRRLAVVRRLGRKRDDLTVTDLGTGSDLARPPERSGAALELLAGVSAELFRASVLISDLPTGRLDSEALHQRFQNLSGSGEETVSVARAVELIDRQLNEVGRTDQPGQTKIGQAIAARQQLEAQIAQLDERRQAVLAEQADLAAMTAREAELALEVAAARRHLAGVQRWTAERRQAALARSEAEIEVLEDKITSLAGLDQVDPGAIQRLQESAAEAEAAAARDRQLAASLREEATATEISAPQLSRQWLEAAWQALDQVGGEKTVRSWWRWLPGAALVAVALLLIAKGNALLAVLAVLLALAAGLVAIRGNTAKGRAAGAVLAEEAGQARLTVELARSVQERWNLFDQRQVERQEKLTRAAALEEGAIGKDKQAEEIRAHLTSLVAGRGGGQGVTDLEAAVRSLAELRQQLAALRQSQHRLRDLPTATLSAWLLHEESPIEGDLTAIESELTRLEGQRAAAATARDTLARTLSRRIGEGADLPELEAARRRAESLVRQRQEERRAMELAAKLLVEVGQEFQRQVGPELSERMGAWLEQLSGGRYNQATAAASGVPRVSGPGEVELRSPDELSQGTQDLIYLSLRLALSELLFPGEPVPLILDEPSAHLDPERHGRLLAALQKIAASRQVVVLTCHPWQRDALVGLGATVCEASADPKIRIRR